MVNNSTYISTRRMISSHLVSLNTLEVQILALDRHKKCVLLIDIKPSFDKHVIKMSSVVFIDQK